MEGNQKKGKGMADKHIQQQEWKRIVAQVERSFEKAIDELQEELIKGKEFITNESACRKIWEDNSTIVLYFEREYQTYVLGYGFREKCGKIAERLAESFLEVEKREGLSLPVQTIEIPFPSLWTERIFDCVQKKRKKPEDPWNQMGNVFWEKTKAQVQMAAVKKMTQEAQICRQSLEIMKQIEMKQMFAEWNVDVLEEQTMEWEEITTFLKKQISRWCSKRRSENRIYAAQLEQYFYGKIEKKPKKPEFTEQMQPSFQQCTFLKEQYSKIEQPFPEEIRKNLQNYYQNACGILLAEDEKIEEVEKKLST